MRYCCGLDLGQAHDPSAMAIAGQLQPNVALPSSPNLEVWGNPSSALVKSTMCLVALLTCFALPCP
jgi:hypothetical protein